MTANIHSIAEIFCIILMVKRLGPYSLKNTCSIFIPYCLHVYVVEKERRIEKYFSVACLGPSDSFFLMLSLFSRFFSLRAVVTFSHLGKMYFEIISLLCMCFFLNYKSGRIGIFL